MSVLSDRTIKEQLASGRLGIDPLDREAIQPASVDLRLDRSFRVFRSTARPFVDVREPVDDLTELVEIGDGEPFVIQPASFCLGSTIETVTLPDDIVARVDGKSSLGRLGLLVHATAGYVDPGWTGRLTTTACGSPRSAFSSSRRLSTAPTARRSLARSTRGRPVLRRPESRGSSRSAAETPRKGLSAHSQVRFLCLISN